MSGLDIANAWRGLKELNVTSAVLDIITFLTAEPVTATLQEQTLQLASMTNIPNLDIPHYLFAFRNGICQCDSSGACPCKSTVVGKKCASCSRGFFGLSEINKDGCTQCFCFGRSRDCEQSLYSWTQVRQPDNFETSFFTVDYFSLLCPKDDN